MGGNHVIIQNMLGILALFCSGLSFFLNESFKPPKMHTGDARGLLLEASNNTGHRDAGRQTRAAGAGHA